MHFINTVGCCIYCCCLCLVSVTHYIIVESWRKHSNLKNIQNQNIKEKCVSLNECVNEVLHISIISCRLQFYLLTINFKNHRGSSSHSCSLHVAMKRQNLYVLLLYSSCMSLLMIALLDFDSCTYVPDGHKSFSFNTCACWFVHGDDPQTAPQPAHGASDHPLLCVEVTVCVCMCVIRLFSHVCVCMLSVFLFVLLIKQTLEVCW